jgi:hypothetical protein
MEEGRGGLPHQIQQRRTTSRGLIRTWKSPYYPIHKVSHMGWSKFQCRKCMMLYTGWSMTTCRMTMPKPYDLIHNVSNNSRGRTKHDIQYLHVAYPFLCLVEVVSDSDVPLNNLNSTCRPK